MPTTRTTASHGHPAPTRDRILAAAAHILSKHGYSETRLTDIAEVAELRAPAVYYYFASRDELISEVMATGQARLREHVEAELAKLPAGACPLTRISTAIAAHLQVELDLSDFATAVTRNNGQLPDELRDVLRTESGEYNALWRELLEDARRQGRIRADVDLRVARLLVMGALNWTPEWWSPEHGALPGVIATAQSLVLSGLSA